MNQDTYITILIILVVALVAFTLSFVFYGSPVMPEYNNGIHANCGGKWEYDGFMITEKRTLSRYSYHCDKCGRSLVLNEWRK